MLHEKLKCYQGAVRLEGVKQGGCQVAARSRLLI